MNYKCMSKKIASLVIIGSILSSNAVYAADAIKKDESVYVTLNQNGIIKEKIVSDWLHSDNSNIDIKDKSTLTGIKNIKGDEKPEILGEDLTWKSNNKDIFYQGETDKKLPFDVKITYKLDGQEIKPEEIAGKSGKVTINIKIKNIDEHKVTVNGKQRTIYTPFAVATLVNLPMDKFTNVKTSEGEIISDGNNQAITFVSIPGLKESLNVDESLLNIDLKDEVEIKADAKDFELDSIMMTATTKVPEMDKLGKADSIDDLQKGFNDLKDATSKLEEGSIKLKEGSNELAVNMNKFNGAIGQLHAGSTDLAKGITTYTGGVKTATNGAKKLNAGMGQLGKGSEELGTGVKKFALGSEQYSNGAAKLANELKNNSGELGAGASKLEEGSKGIQMGAQEIAKNTEKISGGLNSLVNNTEPIKAGIGNIASGMEQSVGATAQLKGAKQKELQGIQVALSNVEAMEQVVNSLDDKEKAAQINEKLQVEKQTLLSMQESGNQIIGGLTQLEGGLLDAKEGSQKLNTGVVKLEQGQKELQQGANKLQVGTKEFAAKTSELAQGAIKLNGGVSQLTPKLTGAVGELKKGSGDLNKGAEEFSKGTKAFGQGVKSASKGTSDLSSGLSLLDSNSNALISGSAKLNGGIGLAGEATSKLNAGAKKVADGNKSLSDNMTKFNKEGIKKIDDKVGNKITDVKDIIDVKDEIVDLSKNYGTFTGLGENMDGNVKFIMKTDEIKKVEVKQVKREENKEEKGGFSNWIKGLFD